MPTHTHTPTCTHRRAHATRTTHTRAAHTTRARACAGALSHMSMYGSEQARERAHVSALSALSTRSPLPSKRKLVCQMQVT
eukprot:5913-Pleurochrysis_carterae.AAC.1